MKPYDLRYFPYLNLYRKHEREYNLPMGWHLREACLNAIIQHLYNDFTGNLDADV